MNANIIDQTKAAQQHRPTVMPEYLDVQGPLLRQMTTEAALRTAQDRAAVAWIVAGCGWAVVLVILCLI